MATTLQGDDIATRTAGAASAHDPLEPVADIAVLPWLYPWFLAMGGILMTLALMR